MKLINLTLEKAKQLQYGDMVYMKECYDSKGNNRKWKVNGKVKTWKKDLNRIKVPVKYGLYNYDYITEDNIKDLLIEEK